MKSPPDPKMPRPPVLPFVFSGQDCQAWNSHAMGQGNQVDTPDGLGDRLGIGSMRAATPNSLGVIPRQTGLWS
jgi:hypothetical protein